MLPCCRDARDVEAVRWQLYEMMDASCAYGTPATVHCQHVRCWRPQSPLAVLHFDPWCLGLDGAAAAVPPCCEP